MVLTESFYCNKAVKQTIFLILLSFYCHKTKQEPRNSVNSAFVGSCVLFELRFEFVICHDFPTLFIKNTTFYTELSTMSPLSPNKNHHLPTTDLIHHHLDNRSPESQTTAASVLLFPRPNSISYHLPQTDMKHHQEFQL